MTRSLVFGLLGLLWPTASWAQVTGSDAARFHVDTIRSILRTVNTAREPFPAPDAVRPEEVFRIGSISGEETTQFTGPIIAVSNGPNGQLLVLDQISLLLRVFGPNGDYIREFGRPGRGPGELSSPSALAWDDQRRLWIPEPFERRYTLFDSAGTFIKTVRRSLLPAVNRRVYPALFDSHGLLDHASYGGGARIARVDTTGAVVDSFPSMRYPPNPIPRETIVAQRDPEWSKAVRHFRPRLRWTLSPDGTIWMATSDSLRLIHRSLEGDTLRVVETGHRPPTFSPTEQRAVERVSRTFEDVELAPTVIQSLHASDDGLLYVQISGELGQPGHEVDVFGAQGEYLGTFELELTIQPLSQSHFVGGYFSYVGVGAYDIPVVVRTRVGR